MTIAVPSSRFARSAPGVAAPPVPAPNMFAAPTRPDTSSSEPAQGIATAQSGTPIPYAKPAASATRPGAVAAPGWESVATPIQAGFNAGSGVPATTDPYANVASVATSTISGAATGALSGAAIGAAGGPIGAVGGAVIGGAVALISSGLNAWLGNRQAASERDRQNAIAADARRIQAEGIARDEKWKVQNRLDSLDAAKVARQQFAAQAAASNMARVGANLKAKIADNAALKAQWANYGFS